MSQIPPAAPKSFRQGQVTLPFIQSATKSESVRDGPPEHFSPSNLCRCWFASWESDPLSPFFVASFMLGSVAVTLSRFCVLNSGSAVSVFSVQLFSLLSSLCSLAVVFLCLCPFSNVVCVCAPVLQSQWEWPLQGLVPHLEL